MRDTPQLPAEILTGRSLDETPSTEFAIPVGDVNTATWAFAKMADARSTLEGIRRQASEWRERIAAWELDASRPFIATIDFFTERLEQWALAERAASPLNAKGEPTVKTVSTPLGKVATRKGTTALAVTDEDALVAWLAEHMPEAVKTVSKPLLPEISKRTVPVRDEGAVYGKLVTPDGEVVPGIWIEYSDPVASVQPER